MAAGDLGCKLKGEVVDGNDVDVSKYVDERLIEGRLRGLSGHSLVDTTSHLDHRDA